MRRKSILRKAMLKLEALEERYLLDAQNLLNGVDTVVNTTTVGDHQNPAVVADSNGNFVAVWEGFNSSTGHSDIFMQRYHSDGTPYFKQDQVVNTISLGTQTVARVAADALARQRRRPKP